MLNKSLYILLFGCGCLFLSEKAFSQSKKQARDTKSTQSIFQQDADSRNPAPEVDSQSLSKKNYSRGKVNNYFKHLDQKVEEYHQRMKENKKRYKKMERLSKKPQYSDPSYFGHKKKPKKRPPGKKKFCKECEMKH